MKIISSFIIAVLFVFVAACGGSGGTTANVPSAPGGLTVALGSDSGQLTLSWDAVDGATSYNLYWSNSPGVTKDISVDLTKAAGTKIENVTSPYANDGLTNGSTYYYIATAVNADGESDASSEVSSVPKLNPVGTLDTDFNGMGYVRWNVISDWGNGVEIDSEGRIVVAGTIVTGGEYDMALWRYNADGTPDTSFGGDGLITDHNAAGGGGRDQGKDVVIDSSGRYVVTGYSYRTGDKYNMVIWRYNADGSLDSTFGTNGIASYDRGVGGNNFGHGIRLDSSGRILVGGAAAGATTNDDMALWRYTDAGAIDTSFGTGGVVFDDNAAGGSGGDTAYGLAVDSSGMIVLTGESANIGGDTDIAVWRFTDSGALDTTFDGDGIAIYDGGNGDDTGRGAVVDSSDRPVITGSATSASDVDMVAIRYTNAGVRDSSFGTNGIATYDSGYNDSGSGINIDSRGRPVMTGMSATAGTPENMVTARLKTDGTFDTTFDTDGVVTFNNGAIADSVDAGRDVAFDDMGRIVIGGVTGAYVNWYMMLWRYE